MQNQQFNFHFSKFYFCASLIVFLASATIIFFTSINFLYQFILFLLLIFYAVPIFLKFIFLKNKNSVISLSQYDKQWSARTQAESRPVIILGDSMCTRLLTVLRMRDELNNKKFVAIIFFDSLSENEYRQLRVKLTSEFF